jgi:hypothetical protein
MPDPKHLVRTHDLNWSQAFHGRHPFNPNCDMRLALLSDRVGMRRVQLNLLRIALG